MRVSYMPIKKTLGIRTLKGEFVYGLFYGLVTSGIYNLVFVKAEKAFIGTPYDLESKKYLNWLMNDGPLDVRDQIEQGE